MALLGTCYNICTYNLDKCYLEINARLKIDNTHRILDIITSNQSSSN